MGLGLSEQVYLRGRRSRTSSCQGEMEKVLDIEAFGV